MSYLRIDVGTILRFCAAAVSLLSLSAASRSTFGQTAAAEPRPAIIVSGSVRNSSGEPVADASVFFEEKATAAAVETKTKPDGSFSFLTFRPGSYTLRAEKAGMGTPATASLLLSLNEKKQINLVLETAKQVPAVSSGAAKTDSSAPAMQFEDKPNFTVAGITDWTNVGGHGSDTKLRTSESLARETAALKSSSPAETPQLERARISAFGTTQTKFSPPHSTSVEAPTD